MQLSVCDETLCHIYLVGKSICFVFIVKLTETIKSFKP